MTNKQASTVCRLCYVYRTCHWTY